MLTGNRFVIFDNVGYQTLNEVFDFTRYLLPFAMVKYFSKLRTKTKTPLAENISHNNLWGIHESLVLMRGRYLCSSIV